MEGASGSVRGVWMIDNIGPRILTSGSFSRDNDNTTNNGAMGDMTRTVQVSIM